MFVDYVEKFDIRLLALLLNKCSKIFFFLLRSYMTDILK